MDRQNQNEADPEASMAICFCFRHQARREFWQYRTSQDSSETSQETTGSGLCTIC